MCVNMWQHTTPYTEAFKSEVRPLKSDVYSFAMVLYELVTGKTPFHDLANVSMVCCWRPACLHEQPNTTPHNGP